MKQLLFLLLLLATSTAFAAPNDSLQHYPAPDTLRAVSFYTELYLRSNAGLVKKGGAGIVTEGITLQVEQKRGAWQVVMTAPGGSRPVANGVGITEGKGRFAATLPKSDTGVYKLLLTKAFDSAQHFSIVSGYVFIPGWQSWKFVASVRIEGWGFLRGAGTVATNGKKRLLDHFQNTAFLRGNNSGRNISGAAVNIPLFYWRGDRDSAQRAATEKGIIEAAVTGERVPALQSHDGVYYTIQSPGTGRQVKVTDTLTVYYKGYLFSDSTVFDQTTMGKPARFPLSGLIPGWKIGLPLLREGGKITLVIPSGLAYSIRTRSAKIPPNSILVFEIEVLKVE